MVYTKLSSLALGRILHVKNFVEYPNPRALNRVRVQSSVALGLKFRGDWEEGERGKFL